MTCNTSAVAVCCSNASRVSVRSRTFSIAMTAWSANVVHQRDLFVGKRPDFLPVDRKGTQQLVVFSQRYRDDNLGARSRINQGSTVLGSPDLIKTGPRRGW